jgi:hypothetical protein
MEATVNTPTKPRMRLTQRINFRMIAVAAVVLFLVGYPIYTYLDETITGGVHNVGNGMKAVDLKALGNFPFDDKVSTINDIPQKWRDLNGQKVILEGFMYAGTSAADNIHSFQFVYNVAKCCFGGPPRVQERVFTVVPNGGTVTNYGSYEMVRCTGTLHVDIKKNEVGSTIAVYTMDLDKVDEL